MNFLHAKDTKNGKCVYLFAIIVYQHRGEAALRINCDTLDTFRTTECKEKTETVKTSNIKRNCKFSENFAIILKIPIVSKN